VLRCDSTNGGYRVDKLQRRANVLSRKVARTNAHYALMAQHDVLGSGRTLMAAQSLPA
jgi:hypothetical protein